MTAPLARSCLRRLKEAYRLGRTAWEWRDQLGWGGLASRALRRLGVTAGGAPDPSHRFRAGYVRPADGAVFDVIYVIGFWPGEPKRYRVFNMAEILSEAGYAVHVMPFDRIDEIRRGGWRASALVLFRAEYDPLLGIEEMLQHARRAGMRLIYDIDDLVFDPTIIDRIDFVHHLKPFERRCFIEATTRRLQLLRACDLVTVSTAALARSVERLGGSAEVIPNSLNREQLRLARDIAAAPPARESSDDIIVCYLSGSPTHQRDFAECSSALVDTMRRHPQVRFRSVGYLDLGPEWDQFGSRVERIGLLPPAELLRCLAGADVNLAPLELGNPFCEAKSELKFFEAALMNIPTIASASATFCGAIEDGVTGMLVRDDTEWRAALELMVTCPRRRRAIGTAARSQALRAYSPEALLPRLIAATGLPNRLATETGAPTADATYA